MKQKTKNIVTIIVTFVIGVIATLFTLKTFGLLNIKTVEVNKEVKNITITESNTIKDSVNKIYDSVMYIESYRTNTAIGSGSGFVYKKDDKYGYVLTNYHVIDKSTKIELTTMEGETIAATLIAGDQYSDIAVLKIDADEVLQVAEIGSSEDINIGDTIFTVGAPLGKDYLGSVTKGIISGKNRSVTVSSQYIMEVIQLDAALNPGNSGGPLANINGEVIGINSLKLVENEVEGMGFAIPIEYAISIAEKLETGKKVERPMLGVSMLNVDSTYQLYKNGIELDPSVDEGIVVVEVADNSPADKAGLKKGDVVLAINDNDTKEVAVFKAELYKYNVGDTITLKIYRNKSIKIIKVNLTAKLEE